MASNNPTMTDPSAGKTAGVDVHNHAANEHNAAHSGSQASNASGLHSQQVAGNADSNTSTSIKGAGATTTEPAAAALGGEEFNLKTPRKQEGSAHAAAGGHIHGQGEEHAKAE